MNARQTPTNSLVGDGDGDTVYATTTVFPYTQIINDASRTFNWWFVRANLVSVYIESNTSLNAKLSPSWSRNLREFGSLVHASVSNVAFNAFRARPIQHSTKSVHNWSQYHRSKSHRFTPQWHWRIFCQQTPSNDVNDGSSNVDLICMQHVLSDNCFWTLATVRRSNDLVFSFFLLWAQSFASSLW